MQPPIIGVDCHKTVHAAVAIDAQGYELSTIRVANTPAGWQKLLAWGEQHAPAACWGLEGSGQYGHGLAQLLLAHGSTVMEVNPRLTATMRRGSRQRSKTDRTDALAVARVVAQEQDALPAVQTDDATAVLAVLVAARDAAVGDATALRNQVHPHLVVLAPLRAEPWPDLTTRKGVATLVELSLATTTALQAASLLLVRQLATRLLSALEQADQLKTEITHQCADWTAPLQEMVGVAALTAGMLAAYLGGRTFADDAALAMYAGVAPLEASSGTQVRHRLNRGGNRQLNAVLHRIALTQSRKDGEGRAYLEKRKREGKTTKEAIRALKRFLVRRMYKLWKRCQIPALTDVTVAVP
jgi:transposase